jgi:hypothetical protein
MAGEGKENRMTTTLVFIHRFSRSVSCRFIIAERCPEPGGILEPTIIWIGKPRRKHFSDYCRWTLYVFQTLADHWAGEIASALVTKNNTKELWLFKPLEAPQLIGPLTLPVSCLGVKTL